MDVCKHLNNSNETVDTSRTVLDNPGMKNVTPNTQPEEGRYATELVSIKWEKKKPNVGHTHTHANSFHGELNKTNLQTLQKQRIVTNVCFMLETLKNIFFSGGSR